MFWVVKGGGWLLGDNPGSAANNFADFHRGGPGYGSNDNDPLARGVPNFGSGTATSVSMDWFLNATAINPRVATMPIGYSVIDAIQPTTNASSLHAGAVGVSNINGCCNARTGGTYLSELLIFNTTLSTADRLAVEDYLNKKWLLGQAVTAGIHLPNLNIVASASSTLDFGNSSDVGSITVNGGGTILSLNHANNTTINHLNGDGSLNSLDTVTPTTLTLAASTGTATFSGSVLGGGANGVINLTKSGGSTQILSGPNTYTGSTLVTNGNLVIAGNSGLPASTNLSLDGAAAIVDLSTFNNTVAGVQLVNGSINGTTGVLTSTSNYELQNGSIAPSSPALFARTKPPAAKQRSLRQHFYRHYKCRGRRA